MKAALKKILFAILIIIIVILLFYDKLPINITAENQIVKALKSYGLKVNSLHVEKLGNSGVVLKNINIGETNLLEIGEAKVQYGIRKIINKQAKDISARDINLNIYEKDGRLLIGGFEPLMEKSTPATNGDNIFYDGVSLKKFLSGKIDISNLHISVITGAMNLSAITNLSLDMEPQPILEASGKDLQLHNKPYQVSIGSYILNAKLDEKNKQWKGKTILENILITGTPSPIPPLKITSDFISSAKDFNANIDIGDAKKTTAAHLHVNNVNLKIDYAKVPWGGGVISTNNVTLPISGNKPVAFDIKIDRVDLSLLLGTLSEGKITGKGSLSGNLPIIYYPDGTIIINDGGAAAIQNGVINVSASLLPGDSKQLQLTRELLQNFHYTKLKITVSSREVDKKIKTAISLVLEGNNPDALEGKKVNFSIGITGDVLPLLQQSILPFNDIKQLMKFKDKK